MNKFALLKKNQQDQILSKNLAGNYGFKSITPNLGKKFEQKLRVFANFKTNKLIDANLHN